MLKNVYTVLAGQGHTTIPETQNICITFIQRRPNVFDDGPKLYKCYTDVFLFAGILLHYLVYTRHKMV